MVVVIIKKSKLFFFVIGIFCFQHCSDLHKYSEKKLFFWSRKTFQTWGWRRRISKKFEIFRPIYSNRERSDQLLKQNVSQMWHTRMGNIWYLSPLVLSKWEDLAFSVSRLFEKSVFILQFLNDKMHNYVKQNITKNLKIKNLNNKHTFLKTEKAKFPRWENLVFSVLRKVCLLLNFLILKFLVMFCLT